MSAIEPNQLRRIAGRDNGSQMPHNSLVCPECESDDIELKEFILAEFDENPQRSFDCRVCGCGWIVEYFPAKRRVRNPEISALV